MCKNIKFVKHRSKLMTSVIMQHYVCETSVKNDEIWGCIGLNCANLDSSMLSDEDANV